MDTVTVTGLMAGASVEVINPTKPPYNVSVEGSAAANRDGLAQATEDAKSQNRPLTIPMGIYPVDTTVGPAISIGPGERLTILAFGFGTVNVGGSRLSRTAGTNPILSAIGNGQTVATRPNLTIVGGLALQGGNTASLVCDFQRAQDFNVGGLWVSQAGASTGLRMRQMWNCNFGVLRVTDCGSGLNIPACLMDAVPGSGIFSAGSVTVQIDSLQLESNNGTDIRFSGDPDHNSPSAEIAIGKMKIEGGVGPFPMVDWYFAKGVRIDNFALAFAQYRTVPLVRQINHNGGYPANMMVNGVIDGNGAVIAHLVEHDFGALMLDNICFLNSTGLTSAVRVGANVVEFSLGSYTGNIPAGKLVSYAKTPRKYFERLGAQVNWDPASIANNGGLTSINVAVPGARLGDRCQAFFGGSGLQNGVILTASVTLDDQVTVTFINFSATNPQDFISRALVVEVWH